MIQAADEEADDALASPVRGGDDVDDEFDPDIRLATNWRNQRVEAERGHISADGVHTKIGLEGREIPVTALPVEGQYLDAAGHDALHKNEREVRVAGPTSSGDKDVFLQPVALDQEGIQRALPVGDGAEWHVSGPGEIPVGWRKR